MVPSHSPGGDEGESDAFLCLLGDHGSDFIIEVACVTREQLKAELLDSLGVPLHENIALEHHTAQLVVLDALFKADCGARISFQIARLL